MYIWHVSEHMRINFCKPYSKIIQNTSNILKVKQCSSTWNVTKHKASISWTFISSNLLPLILLLAFWRLSLRILYEIWEAHDQLYNSLKTPEAGRKQRISLLNMFLLCEQWMLFMKCPNCRPWRTCIHF